uniref:Secreted protein n=1 Tax=Panstrongylus lignarius TaxID=156445 RepID=A0A224Y258_9HEMI
MTIVVCILLLCPVHDFRNTSSAKKMRWVQNKQKKTQNLKPKTNKKKRIRLISQNDVDSLYFNDICSRLQPTSLQLPDFTRFMNALYRGLVSLHAVTFSQSCSSAQ